MKPYENQMPAGVDSFVEEASKEEVKAPSNVEKEYKNLSGEAVKAHLSGQKLSPEKQTRYDQVKGEMSKLAKVPADKGGLKQPKQSPEQKLMGVKSIRDAVIDDTLKDTKVNKDIVKKAADAEFKQEQPKLTPAEEGEIAARQENMYNFAKKLSTTKMTPGEEGIAAAKRENRKGLVKETLVDKFNDAHLYNNGGKFQLALSNGDTKEFNTKNEALDYLSDYSKKDYSWAKDKESRSEFDLNYFKEAGEKDLGLSEVQTAIGRQLTMEEYDAFIYPKLLKMYDEYKSAGYDDEIIRDEIYDVAGSYDLVDKVMKEKNSSYEQRDNKGRTILESAQNDSAFKENSKGEVIEEFIKHNDLVNKYPNEADFMKAIEDTFIKEMGNEYETKGAPWTFADELRALAKDARARALRGEKLADYEVEEENQRPEINDLNKALMTELKMPGDVVETLTKNMDEKTYQTFVEWLLKTKRM